jgi:hypothetical protein
MRQRRACVWLLAFVLVAAQMLGFMHRIVHAPALPSALPSAIAGATATAATPALLQATRQADAQPHQHPWAQKIFAGHEGDDPGCRLFDLLGAGAPLPQINALPAMVVPTFYLAWSGAQFIARWAALFDARGPPDLR